MDLSLFKIGDIVTLKVHPFFDSVSNIILSGEVSWVPPLMLVSEIHKSTYNTEAGKQPLFKYETVWFSTKNFSYVKSWFTQEDLKLILSTTYDINKSVIKRGDKIQLKTSLLELSKKKSSLSLDDNSVNDSKPNVLINSLLTHLPPLMQVMEISEHKSKNPVTNKKGEETRKVCCWDIKCLFFNPLSSKMSQEILPLEVLEIVLEPNKTTLNVIQTAINDSNYLHTKAFDSQWLLKPRTIAFRQGGYFLRGYDYLLNKMVEIKLEEILTFDITNTPFEAKAPSFQIKTRPESATREFINNEIKSIISRASSLNAYLRIKYKDKNEQITQRTVIKYDVITVREYGVDVDYIDAYCLLRKDRRTFKIENIQSIQQLKVKYQ